MDVLVVAVTKEEQDELGRLLYLVGSGFSLEGMKEPINQEVIKSLAGKINDRMMLGVLTQEELAELTPSNWFAFVYATTYERMIGNPIPGSWLELDKDKKDFYRSKVWDLSTSPYMFRVYSSWRIEEENQKIRRAKEDAELRMREHGTLKDFMNEHHYEK